MYEKRMPKVLGIDPGMSGALAWVLPDGRLVEIEDMPLVDGRVNGTLLAKLIVGYGKLECAVVETQQAFPKRPGTDRGQGVVSSFKTGVGFGIIIGVLAALEIPAYYISSAAWKKILHLTSDKEKSRKAALDRWPAQSDYFKLKKHEGRAEAALLAISWLQSSTRAELQQPAEERPNSKRRLIPRLALSD